jgi:hypothetical protein|tara:strand:+ start:94 stop:375 length:282 start_codon:yes stop_codon:yes gene_type:complete
MQKSILANGEEGIVISAKEVLAMRAQILKEDNERYTLSDKFGVEFDAYLDAEVVCLAQESTGVNCYPTTDTNLEFIVRSGGSAFISSDQAYLL